jgi:phage baseplate assembly protein V
MQERALARLLYPLARRIGNLLSRGVVATSNAAGKMQTLQAKLLADEVKDGLEHFEPYGYTSRPKPGAELLAAFLDGDRSNGVILVASDRRYRIAALEEGEVAIYTDEGDSIILKRGRLIEVTTETFRVNAGTAIELIAPTITGEASSGVTLTTPLVSASGSVTAAVDVSDQGGAKTMAGMRSAFNTHTHPGDSGGTTGTPNGSM